MKVENMYFWRISVPLYWFVCFAEMELNWKYKYKQYGFDQIKTTPPRKFKDYSTYTKG